MRNSVFFAAAMPIIVAVVVASAPAPARAGEARSVTAGYIAKFLKSGSLGDSVLVERGGSIGLGTTSPKSALDIRARNALAIKGGQPFVTFRDAGASNARHEIRSVGGAIELRGEDVLNATNPLAFLHVGRDGRVGFGTTTPLRTMQIGPSPDAAFTIEASDQSPRAGFIRFGDNTGWQFRIGRQREFSGGPLNSGENGTLLQLNDNGAFRLGLFPLGNIGTQPLCRIIGTLANFITPCQSSSVRYKTGITPYEAGLETIDRLHPIAFTRTQTGSPGVGLSAEEVAAIDPRLAFLNENGEVEGIYYELLSVLFVNAIKAQQAEIEAQRTVIESLETRLARLEAAPN